MTRTAIFKQMNPKRIYWGPRIKMRFIGDRLIRAIGVDGRLVHPEEGKTAQRLADKDLELKGGGLDSAWGFGPDHYQLSLEVKLPKKG